MRERERELGRFDSERRYHMFLGIIAVAFAVWIGAVVVSNMVGDNQDVGDDVQLVTMALGVLALFLGQHRLNRGQKQIYEHVNNVESSQAVPDGEEPKSLGQLARQIRDEARDGLAEIKGAQAEQHRWLSSVHGEVMSLRVEQARHLAWSDDTMETVQGRIDGLDEKLDGALDTLHEHIDTAAGVHAELRDRLDRRLRDVGPPEGVEDRRAPS